MCKAAECGRIDIPQSLISFFIDTQDKLVQKVLGCRQIFLQATVYLGFQIAQTKSVNFFQLLSGDTTFFILPRKVYCWDTSLPAVFRSLEIYQVPNRDLVMTRCHCCSFAFHHGYWELLVVLRDDFAGLRCTDTGVKALQAIITLPLCTQLLLPVSAENSSL